MRRGLGFHNRRSPGVFSPLSLFAGGVQGAWYDPSDPTTLFSDRAGTTPCGTPGGGSVVPVGLMLDKSQGLVLGPELVDTANTTAGWAAYGTNVVSQITNGVSIQYSNDARGAKTIFDQAGNLSADLSAGLTYEFRFTVSVNSGTVQISLLNLGTPPSTITITTTPQSIVFRSARTAFAPEMQLNGLGAAQTVSITGISVKLLTGNHAIAANDTTARPELSARVNLLTYSEQFDNAAWTKTNTTINATKVSDPTGSTTAQQIFETTTNAGHFVLANGFASVANVQFTSSVYVKANGRTKGQVLFYDANGAGSGAGVNFDLATETVTNYFPFATGTVVAKSITPFGSGWYRVSVTSTTTTSSGFGTFLVRFLDDAGNISYAGDVTKGMIVWGADLRPANIGTTIPAYQRIADQYTYDAVGFPRYLAFNGTSSAMSTPANVNLSGTDKATWFLGARKISDVNWKWAFAFNNPVGNSSFGLTLPEDAGQPNMGFYLRGTASVGYVPTGYVAPLNLVLSAACDLAAATKATSLVPKVNGTVQQTAGSGTTPGGGTFASAILSIGGYSSQLFQGNIYSLIVAGSAVSAANITATEQWIANKEGVVI